MRIQPRVTGRGGQGRSPAQVSVPLPEVHGSTVVTPLPEVLPAKAKRHRISDNQKETDARAFHQRAVQAAEKGTTRKEFAKQDSKLSNAVASILQNIYETYQLAVVLFPTGKKPKRSKVEPLADNIAEVKLYKGGRIKEEDRFPYAIIPRSVLQSIGAEAGDMLVFDTPEDSVNALWDLERDLEVRRLIARLVHLPFPGDDLNEENTRG